MTSFLATVAVLLLVWALRMLYDLFNPPPAV